METLLALTLSGSGLALLLLALRYLILRRMPSTVYYYAWLLVLLRFVLPLPGLVQLGNDAPAPLPYQERAVWDEGVMIPALPPVDTAPGLVLEQAAPEIPDTPADPQPVTSRAPAKTLTWRSPRLWLTLWAVGAALCFGVTVFSYLRFTRSIQRSLRKPDASVRALCRAIPGRKPALWVSDTVRTPLMYGLLSPRIVLPARDYDAELLGNILRHELTHYRRCDTLYKWFAAAVLSLHWFNPLSWLIRRELNRACELSCDEMLLRSMTRDDKQSYGNTLLTMAASSALPAGVVATTFSTEKKNLKERLEQIMNYKKSGRRLLAAVLTLALVLGCALIAGPASAEEPTGGTVRVSTVDELLAAIAPDTVIELAPGTYDLSAAADYGSDTHSGFYSWNGVYDGFELVLHGVENLTLRGAGMGETVLAAMPRYANVLRFTGCADVTVADLTAGHTTEPGWCQGGVLYFEGGSGIAVERCGLYGCGTIGVQARECTGLTVKDSDIYECSYGALNVHSCREVALTGCDIHDHGTRAGQGEALNLIEARYSEGITVDHNRIHDNRAQYLLNLDYVKRALFLSNDVTGNAFRAGVFCFREYGATVDGCRFEGNDLIAWYLGEGGRYATNVYGEPLESAMFMEMTLADIDPDTVLPPVTPAGAAEVPEGGEIVVTTVDEFLAALGPDRTITLDGALFDLSTASNYGGIGTDAYFWQENYDGPALVIHDVKGLSITAKNTESGATTLAAIPRYADVLSFRNCENLFLGGFTAGHTKEPGACSGGVLSFQGCNGVTIEKMRLYGCGILGVQASGCSSLNILRTEIYECSQGAGMFFRTDGINFVDCDVHDVPSPALSFHECGDKTWNGEPFTGLDVMYDVDENGALAEFAYPEREEEEEYHGAVLDLVNPFAYEPTFSYPENGPERRFILAVQRAVADGDWEALADRIGFPIQFFDDGYSFVIHDRAEFLDMVPKGDFEGVLFSDAFRERIAAASAEECGQCIFGATCLDHLIAFAGFGMDNTDTDYRIRAISNTTPLWPGRPQDPNYVQVTPEP